MTAEYIHKFATACEKFYKTRDPENIFLQRRAVIRHASPEGLRGMICIVDRAVLAAIDPTLPESAQIVTAAHLLGHALLHVSKLIAGKTFEEPYDDIFRGGAEEREADIFAAELLITDEEILKLRDSGMNEGQLASSFGAIRDLVPHKLFSMRSRGISVSDEVCRADFLKRCDVELFF